MRPLLVALALALVLAACQRSGADGPPPEDKLELASAAPGALGALAAGTDAAPPPPSRARRTWVVPGDEAEEDVAEPEEPDAGGAEAPPGEPPPREPAQQDLPL